MGRRQVKPGRFHMVETGFRQILHDPQAIARLQLQTPKELVSMHPKYDQAGLDAQYNLRERVTDFQDYIDGWETESQRVRESIECRLNVAYGDAPGQTLDVFPATGKNAPVHVFIHGGYWRALDKEYFSFVAEPLVAAGAAVLTINYALAPSVGVGEIVR
jgi:acetyl esterase/lipase